MKDHKNLVQDAQNRINKEIRKTLKEKSMTQVKLAELSGVSQPHIARLLRGDRGKIPTELLRVLDALGLELTVQPKGGGGSRRRG